jgi:transposase-like protein
MKRRSYTSEFKSKVVLEVLRGEKTLGEIAAEHEINPNMLTAWKREFLDRAPAIFDETRQTWELRKAEQAAEAEKSRMLKTIGQLTMERDYLQAAVEKQQSHRRLL